VSARQAIDFEGLVEWSSYDGLWFMLRLWTHSEWG